MTPTGVLELSAINAVAQHTVYWSEQAMNDQEIAQRLGQAVLSFWAELPRNAQEMLFTLASSGSDPDYRERLAIFLHDRHPRTLFPEKPTKIA